MIKRARLKDLAVVTDLYSQYRQFYKQEARPEEELQFMEERLVREDSIIYLSYREGKAAGFVQLYPLFSSVAMKRVYILNDLFVHPTHRKKGVGEELINRCYQLAEEEGVAYITLQTAHDNYTAQRLYERLEMIEDTKFKRYSRFY